MGRGLLLYTKGWAGSPPVSLSGPGETPGWEVYTPGAI